MSLGISSGGWGFPVITWQDVRVWAQEMGLTLDPWEKRAIILLGQRRAAVLSEEQEKKMRSKS